MSSIIDEIKAKTTIVEQVGSFFEVTGRGRVLTTVEHDSLKLWPAENRWWWFSRGVGGDVIDWYATMHKCDLSTAIDALARSLNLQRRPLTAEEQRLRAASERQQQVLALAAGWFAAQMWGGGGAGRRYCQSRGWSDETVRREGIGLSPAAADNNTLSIGAPLANVLREAGLLDEPAAKAVLSVPAGMIVYVHREFGRVVYLSARSILGKRHWNLPSDLVGGKRMYANQVHGESGLHVLVEGQADAIALGQMGVAATALCGIEKPDGLARTISHVGLDSDRAGAAKAVDLALAIDPLTRIVQWPHKDAADWLSNAADADPVPLFHAAPTALECLARQAKRQRGDERQASLRRLCDAFDGLDEVNGADLKRTLAAALGENIAQFNRLLAARRKEREEENEKESPARYEYSAGGCRGSLVWEQIVISNDDGSLRCAFAVRNQEGQIEQRPMLTVGETTFVPYPATMDLIVKRVVLFPSAASEYGSQRELLKEVQEFIHHFLDIDPFFERLAAYYVLFTWLYDSFENLPYLRSLGDYGTGKTRFIQTIGALCYRPMFCSGAATVSPIFRIIDMFGGTLVVDEADLASSDAENELIKIFNVGYYRGGNVLRSKKDPNQDNDEYWPSASSVYCPKILATRKPFTDRATESRCLTKRMGTARPRPGIPFTLDRHFWLRAQDIRNQLLMYRLRSQRDIEIDQSLADPSIEPRLNQVTMALKSVVDHDMRAELDRFVRAYNDLLIADRQMTLPSLVVQSLVNINESRSTDIFGRDNRDWTMKNIADVARKLVEEIDPDVRINPKTISRILTEDLGLARRSVHPESRRAQLIFDQPELRALMVRFGLTQEETQIDL